MSQLKTVQGRVVLLVDPEQKNWFTFQNGQTIRLERDYENFDRSYTQQVLGTCLDAETIPKGALVLFHFNAIHDVNTVFNHKALSGEEIAAGIKVISIPEWECFLWKMPGEKDWQPLKGFAIAERVFRPYEGLIAGIEPKRIVNVLYIKTGELKGRVCRTLTASDYTIKFRNEKGVDEAIIRVRHFEDEYHEREELIAIDHTLTEQVNQGKLLVGYSPTECSRLPDRVKRMAMELPLTGAHIDVESLSKLEIV